MTEAEIATAYERYGLLVLQRCRRILRDVSAAEDALQEVFVRVLRSYGSFAGADSKVAWLYRVADRCCFDQLRKRKLNAPPALVGHVVQTVEDRDLVLRFLERFDARLQQVAVFHFVDGMTHEEIATATGWSRQTVYNKLVFLRERAALLRRCLVGGDA